MKNKITVLKEAIRKEVDKLLVEAKKDKLKPKPKSKKRAFEGVSVQDHGVEKDDVGTFWVVTAAQKDSTNENNIFETDIFNFSQKVREGLALESIKGIFKKEDRARRLGERFIKERQKAVDEATASAQKLKGLRDTVKNQVGELKKTKVETAQKVKKINEAPKTSIKKK